MVMMMNLDDDDGFSLAYPLRQLFKVEENLL